MCWVQLSMSATHGPGGANRGDGKKWLYRVFAASGSHYH